MVCDSFVFETTFVSLFISLFVNLESYKMHHYPNIYIYIYDILKNLFSKDKYCVHIVHLTWSSLV